jgi:YVTN family beta-propeller protein
MYVAGVIVDRSSTGQVSDTLTLSVISRSNNQVIANVPIAGGSREVGDIGGIAFDPANGNLYVTSILTDTAADVNLDNVYVISTATNQVIATIPISGPEAVAFDPANDNVYVASGRSNAVFVIDPATNQVIATIHLAVTDFAFDPANGNLYMAGLNGVSVISSSTNQVISTIPLANPDRRGIVFDPAKGNMYVTNNADNSVSVISTATNQVISTIPVGTHPQGIAFDPANGNVYVANIDSNSVSVISTTTPETPPPSSGDTIPPDTVIASAVDGNNAPIPTDSNGVTVSNKIAVSFTGTDNTGISGFECSIDNQPAIACNTSPVIFQNLQAGTAHTFQVRAIDLAGNSDPTPASFMWTILTPSQGIKQLLSLSQSMNLNPGMQSMITGLLNSAAGILSDNNPINDKAACNQLNVLISQLNSKVQSKQITAIQASQLIQSSPYSLQSIEKVQGC